MEFFKTYSVIPPLEKVAQRSINLVIYDIPLSAIIYNIKPFCIIFSVTDELTVITISKYYLMLWQEFIKPRRSLVLNHRKEQSRLPYQLF